MRRVLLRRKEAEDSTEVLGAASLWSAIPAWERRGAVAVGIVARGSGPADEAVDGTPVAGAGTREAVADLAEPTGCADVSDCRLRGWRGCCGQKRYPSLRDPSTVPSSTTAFLSFFPFLSSPLPLPLLLLLPLHLLLLHLRLLLSFILYPCSPCRSSSLATWTDASSRYGTNSGPTAPVNAYYRLDLFLFSSRRPRFSLVRLPKPADEKNPVDPGLIDRPSRWRASHCRHSSGKLLSRLTEYVGPCTYVTNSLRTTTATTVSMSIARCHTISTSSFSFRTGPRSA